MDSHWKILSRNLALNTIKICVLLKKKKKLQDHLLNFDPSMHAKSLQYLTLGSLVDCSSPGSSVHGIPQTRILEWVAMSFSRGSSQLRDWTQVSYHLLHWQAGTLPLVPPGKPRGQEMHLQTHIYKLIVTRTLANPELYMGI